ncbi:MAG: SpoIID/LytB domain-containing protein [Bryobacteraceae bacterium]|nr:SpoIID/LytB domain-containing protein [Bryobacteraceae bacterium]
MAPLTLLLAVEVTVRTHWIQGGGETLKMPMEEYVAAVLGGEAAGMRSPESMKAMAVASRTYAARFRGRHSREGFDFCDTTHCQDYRRAGVTQAILDAADSTEGELLWYKGALAAAYYSANCGGMSEVSSEGPYLNQHRDIWCLRQPDVWRTVLSHEEVLAALKAARYPVPAMFTQIAVVTRTPSNRATRLNVGGAEVDAGAFRNAVGRTLGWDKLPSGWFDVANRGGQFVFAGRGRGHGIGLCQTSCARMGEEGKTYREILAFAYPGTVVGLTASGFAWRFAGGERVDVLTTQSERALVERADRALREAELRAGLRFDGRPRLRVYPTVAAFRDATGQPGTVAAIARGSTIQAQPRVSEVTLRHEMLHVVLESNTRSTHPWWFREGLALALNDERSADPRYAQAVKRVNELIARNGRETVMRFWRDGLPADSNPREVEQPPSQPKAQKSTQ